MPQPDHIAAFTAAVAADAAAASRTARAVTQRVLALQISQAIAEYGPALVLDAAADACHEHSATASGSDRYRTAAELTVIGDVLRDSAARLTVSPFTR